MSEKTPKFESLEQPEITRPPEEIIEKYLGGREDDIEGFKKSLRSSGPAELLEINVNLQNLAKKIKVLDAAMEEELKYRGTLSS